MSLPDHHIGELAAHYPKVISDLRELQLAIVSAAEPFDRPSRVREHLLHGAARRVRVIQRAIENVFAILPPNTTKSLTPDSLADAQINLHAFVMNLYGLHDNWAWAFVLHHDLEKSIGGRKKIGLFVDATKNRLPQPIKVYLSTRKIVDWHEKYLKAYRDALAHRIPLYIPPRNYTDAEGERHNELDKKKLKALAEGDLKTWEAVQAEQASLGQPCFWFLHAFIDEPPKPTMIHAQMLTDSMSVVEFGQLFLEHWRDEPTVV